MSENTTGNSFDSKSQDMKVYILDIGYLECDANMVVSGTVLGTKNDPNPRLKWIKIPTFSVLVDHPDFRFLYDLGTHPDHIFPDFIPDLFPYYNNENQTLESQLALAGYEPDDIPVVILSHLHFDHCGHLHLFDHADCYVHPKELKNNPDIKIKKPHPISEDTSLFKGVEIITLPGHTEGVLGLVLHLKNEGTLIFASDALYTPENYGPPARTSGTVADTLSYFKSVEKIRNLEQKYDAKIMYAHYMESFTTMKKAPDYYD